MTDTAQQTRVTRTRAVALGAVVPTAIAVVTAAITLSWLPQLPDPIAVHWSGAGPDGFGPALPFVLAPLVITIVFSVFVALWSWRPTPSGRLTWNQKFLVVTSLWLATMLNVGFAASLAVQRGLSDAHEAPDVGLWLAIGAGAGLLLAVVGWFVLPPAETVDEAGSEPRRVDVQGQERISWSHSVRLSNAALAVIAFVVAIALVTAILVSLASRAASVVAILTLVFVALLAATTTWWRVSADRRGFIAAGIFGWPRKRIPLHGIRSVQVVEVDPSRDFGGWGWRWGGNGRTGIIARAGRRSR